MNHSNLPAQSGLLKRKVGHLGRSLIATTLALVVLPVATSAAGFGDSGATGTFSLSDWNVDRFAPGGWAPGSTDLLSGTALKITISNADRENLRPPAFSGLFYTTQGRVRLSPGVTEVGGELFIPTSWGTPGNLRRSDVWSRDNNPVEGNSRYQIFGFINNDPADPFNPLAANFVPRIRTWDSTIGWADYPAAPILYGQYNKFRIVDTGSSHQYWLNGTLIDTNSGSSYSAPGSEGLRQVILNSYNFGNAGNSLSLPDSGYEVFWKNAYALSANTSGIPVDLNGSYMAAGNFDDGITYLAGSTSVTTAASPNMVFEEAMSAIVTEGTLTPFSDDNKQPTALENLDLRGKSFSADLDLGSVSSWSDPFPTSGNEFFQFGLGDNAGIEDDTEESYVFIYRNGNHFTLHYNSDWSEYAAVPSLQYDADPAATKFRVNVDINGAGTTATMTVTPLDGPDAFNATTLDPFPLLIDDNVSSTSFFAGFTSNAFMGESGRVVVSNFKTTATTNTQYVFANDPYNLPSQSADFAVGQANLAVAVGGYQSFLESTNLTGAMGFGSGTYTAAPYPAAHIFNGGAITAAGELTGGVAPLSPLVTADATLANILMTGANGTSGYVGIKTNNGGVLDTQFSDGDGNAILTLRRQSNVAMWDSVAPVISGLTALQGVNYALVAPGVQTGLLNVNVTAQDAFTGLDDQPTITINFAPLTAGPEDVVLNSVSVSGNTFGASYNVPANAPNGPGQIIVTAVDRAGNSQSLIQSINVNTATFTLNLQLQGFDSEAGSVTRGIEIILGGTSGGNAPITLSRDVTFSQFGMATVVFNSGDGLLNGAGFNYTIGAKDSLHTLRTTVAATGVGNQYSASATLRGGNLNRDNKIDIGDYVVYATRFGIPVNPNTPFVFPAVTHVPTLRHADISGDGVVDSQDFSFFTVLSFGTVDDNAPGNYSREDRTIRTRITVAQAMIESGSRQVANMDFNRDGIITMEEAQRYISRLR